MTVTMQGIDLIRHFEPQAENLMKLGDFRELQFALANAYTQGAIDALADEVARLKAQS